MRKILAISLAILSTGWFTLVSLGLGTYLGVSGICALQKCSRDLTYGAVPPPLFSVMVRDQESTNNVTSVLLKDLDGYLASNPGDSLYLRNRHGVSIGGEWDYSIISEDHSSQIVKAHYLDGASIVETYRVSVDGIQPLTSRIWNAGYLFASLPFGIAFALAIRKMARGWSKRINGG